MNNASTLRGPVIADPAHPLVTRVRRLQDRAERDRTGLFRIEGVRFLMQAGEQRARFDSITVCPQLLVNPVARQIVERLAATDVPVLAVSPSVLRSIALAEDPQGIIGVVRQRWLPLERIKPRRGLCWVALAGVRSAGNLGTALRTADAVGAAGVILLGDTVDPFDPATVRATMGALFTQRFVRASWEEFLDWKRRRGCRLIGASPAATNDYQAIAYEPPVVLLMGTERKGLSPEQLAACDCLVTIPMVGRSDSLNLGVATSVLLYEVFNQRRRAVQARGDTSV